MTIADCGNETPVVAMLTNCCAPLFRARRSAGDESVAAAISCLESAVANSIMPPSWRSVTSFSGLKPCF